MPKPVSQPFDKAKVVADNRRAYYEYFVEEKFEAGIELRGLRRSPGHIPNHGLNLTSK